MSRDGVLVVRAHNLHMKVERGELVVSEGSDHPDCRRASFPRWRPPRRIALVGSMGIVTIAALRWLQDTGCGMFHVDGIGRVTMVSVTPRLEDARLRRAQALLPYGTSALPLARSLLARKLQGQHELLHSRRLGTASQREQVRELAVRAEVAGDIDGALSAESAAARVYWSAWRGVEIRFARREAVSDRWRRFEQRSSELHRGPRYATDPANALLNYCYALAEAEVRVEIMSFGLDPALGLLHTDEANRASLALDLLEPLRPLVDQLVLELLSAHVWRHRNFGEEPDGRVRLALETAGLLPDVMARLRPLIAQEVEAATVAFATEAKRLGVGVLPKITSTKRPPTRRRVWLVPPPQNCVECGAGPLTAGQSHCVACLDAAAGRSGDQDPGADAQLPGVSVSSGSGRSSRSSSSTLR